MRYAHTVAQVREAEAALMARLPEGALMQRAATGLAYAVIDLLGGAYGRRVLLLIGSGDNGGDALHAGALLASRGASVEAWLLSDRAHEGGLEAFRRAGGQASVAGARGYSTSRRPDVVIDGIVGIGGRPGLKPEAAEVVEVLRGAPVVAVDVPSGVGVDTGEIDGPHVTADVTVTFGTHKACHLVQPAAEACGAVHLVDIGLELPSAELEALQPDDVAAMLPRPRAADHKYTRGVVGVRAGSATYPGAALLAISGANTGLVGMVRFVGDDAVSDAVRREHPEVVGDGRVQAWVVGPGTSDTAGSQLKAALEDDVPLVIDADALAQAPRPLGRAAVLTPHAGELAGMLGIDRADIEARPLEHVRRAAAEYDATVLLKGRHTVVARPDGRVRATTTGTAWLATAGAGDVLAGVVGALLAAGLDPFDAAGAGSWLHGAAATLAGRAGPLTAVDVAPAVADVVRALL